MRLLRAGQRGAPPLNCGVRRHMSRQRALQIGFVAYWVVFVLFAVHQGRYPGFFDDPANWPYPYSGVAKVCLLITLLLAVLYLVYPPSLFPYSRSRVGFALAYAVVLFVVGFGPAYTDQPA